VYWVHEICRESLRDECFSRPCWGLGRFAQAQHKPKDAECLACHSDQTLTTDVNGRKVSLYIDADKMKQSVHGGTFACVDCHKDVKSSPHAETPAKVECATCHAEEQTAYQHSYHATARSPTAPLPPPAPTATATRTPCCLPATQIDRLSLNIRRPAAPATGRSS